MVNAKRGVLLLLLSLVSVCKAQDYDPEERFTIDRLHEDFALLKRALQTTHPGLNRYVTPQETEHMFAEISARLNRPMTEREFFREVTLLSSVINCGHTRFRRSAAFYGQQDDHASYLPVRLRILGDRAYVLHDGTKEGSLTPGSEILRINGQAISALIERMMLHLPGDGTIRTGRTKVLEDNFPALYKDLIDQPGDYEVELIDSSGSVKLVRVEPLTPAESDKVGQVRYPELSEPRPAALALEVRSNVAVLTIRSFGNSVKDASGNDYNTFLDQSFRKIQEKEISNLIVDLRENGGGSDEYGARLFSYLSEQPFEYYDHLGVVVEHVDFLKHTSLPQDFNEEIKKRVREDDLGRRVAVGHPNLQTQQPIEPGFRGRVIFLIDRGSFSATAEFASVAHNHKRGIFIGEETGGGYHGNTSGMGYLLTLPHTKLRINIPMIKYVSAVSGNPFASRGIIPDYRVLPTIEEILSGADPVLESALRRIRQLQGQ
jgi:hypothetical protein